MGQPPSSAGCIHPITRLSVADPSSILNGYGILIGTVHALKVNEPLGVERPLKFIENTIKVYLAPVISPD